MVWGRVPVIVKPAMARHTDTDDDDADAHDLDYPRDYNSGGSEHGTVLDAFDDLRPGDRVLWGDRKQALTVARVVEPDDREGQALTASTIRASNEWLDDHGSDLRNGDVFLNPTSYHGMTGRRFVLIHGPRGGFYAIVQAEKNGRPRPALFRAVRSAHKTKLGQPGEGAFGFEGWFSDPLEVVESGDAPDELDPVGDLPSYEEIQDSPLVSYDTDASEHYTVSTVAEAFDEGLESALNRAARERGQDDEDEEASPWDDVPAADRVAGTPGGYSHSTVTVTEIYESEYGLKAVLDGPAPWETPDGEEPMNEVLKATPWEENHRTFDGDRKAWTVDADELVAVASTLRDARYSVVDEADRPTDADDDQDPEIRTDGGQDTDAHSEPVPLTRHRNVSDGLAECGQCDRLYSTVVNPLRCPACGDPRRRTRAYAGP